MNKFLFVRFPGGRAKALTFSYDDGVQQDQRFVGLLDQHGMKGTFNLNSGCFTKEGKVFEEGRIHRRMTEREIVELFENSHHEVAIHSLTHPFLEVLPSAVIAQEVIEDRLNLEHLFGRIVRGMAYPMGTFNDKTVEVLKSCGIAYARTTVSTEKFDLPTDWLRMPATCHHKNPRLMELARQFVEMDVPNHAKLFYLWGHTYEFEANNNWNIIEDFVEYMSGRENDIWYATNMEIHDYLEAYGQLIFSADCERVYNPTVQKLWFSFNGKPMEIAPGETLMLG